VAGLVLVVVLAAAGGLLLWGHNFADSQVTTQLSAQKIVFPTTGNAEFKALPPADQAAMGQYAGQQLTTGAQAKVYADNFIAFHLSKMGGTYSQLSAQSLAQPSNAKLAALVNTVFKGTTLRGMLLNAYAFWQMGVIALWGAIVSFIGAGLLLILSGLGFLHARWTSPATEILPAHRTDKIPATAS
jgi:predicted Zn-dependent protease